MGFNLNAVSSTSYFHIPYTRFYLIFDIITRIFWSVSSVIIGINFTRSVDFSGLISIDHIIAPLALAGMVALANRYREFLYSHIHLLLWISMFSAIVVDLIFWATNSYSLFNFLLQTFTDVFIYQFFRHAFGTFHSRVFMLADSERAFSQWLYPFSLVCGVIGGVLSLFLTGLSLRFLICIQLVFDISYYFMFRYLLKLGQDLKL